jgi:hypothetical protein
MNQALKNTQKRIEAVKLLSCLDNKIGEWSHIVGGKTYHNESTQSIYSELNRLGYFWKNRQWIFSQQLLEAEQNRLNFSEILDEDMVRWIDEESRKLGFSSRSKTVIFLLKEHKQKQDGFMTDEEGKLSSLTKEQLRYEISRVAKRLYYNSRDLLDLAEKLKGKQQNEYSKNND